MQKIWVLGSILLTIGCSQRAPWVVPTAPVAAPRSVSKRPGPSAQAQPALSAVAAAPADATAVAHLNSLLFPVPGVDSTRLDDTFDEPRDGGARRHNAIDIMAPRGAPVLAVQDGRVLSLARSSKGGITVYATDLDEQFVYYYAHLNGYHPDLYAGKPLMRADTLGFVGTTGNAPADTPHLHFQVMRMPADHRYWDGEPINPFPLLRATATAPAGK